MKQTAIDIRLERDERYVAAKARYTELQTELNALERQRDDVQAGIGSLTSGARDRIDQEATALLSGTPGPENLNRATLTKTLNELMHRLAVLRSAVEMQKGIVADLRGVVGMAIATDLLPQHKANVARVAETLIQLSAALEAEAKLRDDLFVNDVPYSAVIRPMALPGVGRLSDNQSRSFRYLLECETYGFVKAADLPDVVRAQIPPPAKPMPAQALAVDPDGWVNA